MGQSKFFIVISVFLLGLVLPASAQNDKVVPLEPLPKKVAPAVPAREVFLGQQRVDFRGDRDVIQVGAGAGIFRSLRLEVEGNDVEVLDLEVTYGNGARDKLPLRQKFRRGMESRLIDLRGNSRAIRSVTLFYKTSGRILTGRATVRVYGIR